MRKFQREQILDIFTSIHALHLKSRTELENKEYQSVQTVLIECQEAAIQVGESIEQLEGDGTEAVSLLEEYCERLYSFSMQLERIDPYKFYKGLEDILLNAETAVKHLPLRKEVVFLPYKVSMWDSLESVYLAAREDESCDAYCIPIPYYDRRSDGTLGQMHYEGNEYPENIEVNDYRSYDFGARRPDAIFIHNPYDQFNNVTSIHPFFYSQNLKKFTDLLIYIPYYATSGGMSDGQKQCIAYYYSDYIVIQAEKYKKFFDSDLPQDKLLPLGSPKFDKVIHICNNPPSPPEDWKRKMKGKKVYFYNTSINGMLGNTSVFLKKMEYVFKCFEDRTDACLIWRPHPLLESTFDSMRMNDKPIYDALKRHYLESDFGIYDDTPEITDTIALCDAYIGDAGTSVTSLFGIAGKPVFILNNYIDRRPEENDWRGEIVKYMYPEGNDEWMITQGNKLYHSPLNNYKYEYFCDLCDYAYGDYYSCVISVEDQNYVCPVNAQNILLIGNHGIEKKIELKHCIEQKGAFYGAACCGKYIFLIPNNYPAIVRYDTASGKVKYIEGYSEVFSGIVEGVKRLGGYCVQNGYLFLASPVDNRILAIHGGTGKAQILTTNAQNHCGCAMLISDGKDLWFFPYLGYVITRWNPESGEMREYDVQVDGLICKHPALGYEFMEKPFGRPALCGDNLYIPPNYANKYLKLNSVTGQVTQWFPPFEQPEAVRNGYYSVGGKSYFYRQFDSKDAENYYLFSILNRKLYEVNLEANESKEIEIEFQIDELLKHEAGFCENSEWLKYACQENAFNSLPDFLDGNITGDAFDRKRQEIAYEEVAANSDGTSGAKIYAYVCSKMFVQ